MRYRFQRGVMYPAYIVCLSSGRKYTINVVWYVLCRALYVAS